MIATRLLEILSDVEGVNGSFVVSSEGELLVCSMPGADLEDLRLTACRVARILQCGEANGVEGEEALFDFGGGKLLVREFLGGYLCVLTDRGVSMRSLRLTARLVARAMPLELTALETSAAGI